MYQSFFDEIIKIAGDEKSLKTRTIEGAVKARPWLKRGITGAIPAAVAANFLLPFEGPTKKKLVAAAGLMGGGLSMGDLALKRWARKHPRRVASKALKKQAAIRKVAAMAADLRRSGIGGVKRPAFATEDSKTHAFQQFQNSQKPGRFTTQTQAKHLKGPGPSIPQIAPMPG